MSGALGELGLKQMLVCCCPEIAAGRCCLITHHNSICMSVPLSESCEPGEGQCWGEKVRVWNKNKWQLRKRWGVSRTPGNAGGGSALCLKGENYNWAAQDLSFPMEGQGVVTFTQQQLPWWHPQGSSKTKWDLGGFPSLPGNGSQLGYLTAGVYRMNPPMPHHETWGHGNSFGGGEAAAAHAAPPKTTAPRPAQHSPAQWPRGRLLSKFSN